MTTDELKNMQARCEWENGLRVGQEVRVRWGYGLGFRAEGVGIIDRIYAKSFRVRLTEDVASPYGGANGWDAGFLLKGIPRMTNWDGWNVEHCVAPIDATQEATE